MANRQFSLLCIFVAVAVFSLGLALLRLAPFLSIVSLIGLFLIASPPGMLIGYAMDQSYRLRGCVQGALISGLIGVGALLIIRKIF